MASAPESSVTFIQGRTKGSRNAIYGGYRYTKYTASFPPVLWNVRGRTLERMNRTNNPVESFHSQFKKFVKTAHPTIWAFIDAMRLQQSDTDGKICSMIVGERPPKRKKTHLAGDDKIFSATNQFDNMELIPYLDLVMNL